MSKEAIGDGIYFHTKWLVSGTSERRLLQTILVHAVFFNEIGNQL